VVGDVLGRFDDARWASQEVERWLSGDCSDLYDEEWIESWAGRVAGEWVRFWPIIEAATNRVVNVEGVNDLALLLGAVVERDGVVEATLIDAYPLASPQVRSLIGASIFGNLAREASEVDNARRAVEVLGQSAVAAAWLRNSATGDEDATRWDFWAWDIVTGLADDPDASWSMILELVAAADDDAIFTVAADPLEDWVKAHAVDRIERIESEAERNEQFRLALGGTWVWSALPDDTFARVAAAAGSSLDAPVTPEQAAERRAHTARFNELCSIANDESLDDSVREEAWQQIMDL
jgi:hypothetical protein